MFILNKEIKVMLVKSRRKNDNNNYDTYNILNYTSDEVHLLVDLVGKNA